MFSFQDVRGRRWNLDMTIGDIRRVKSLLGVDLLDAQDGKILSQFADDPCLTVDVLYVIVKPQADDMDVSDEDFGGSLDGEALRSAVDAFIEALVDFFVRFRPETGNVLRGLWEKLTTYSHRGGEMAIRKLQSPAMDRILQAELEKAERQIDSAMDKATGGRSSS